MAVPMPNGTYRKIPWEDYLVRGLNHYDDFFRAYCLKWALANLCPRDLAWYHKAAMIYYPWYSNGDKALVDRMGEKVKSFMSGQRKWIPQTPGPFRANWADGMMGYEDLGAMAPALQYSFPQEQFAILPEEAFLPFKSETFMPLPGEQETILRQEAYLPFNRQDMKALARQTWARPMGSRRSAPPVAMGDFMDDFLQAHTATQPSGSTSTASDDFGDLYKDATSTPSTSTPTQQTTAATGDPWKWGGFDARNPNDWMKLVETGTKTVSSIACTADPKLPFCPGAQTPSKPPATMEDLCKMYPTFGPCVQYQQAQAKAQLCKMYPAQCVQTPASAVPPKTTTAASEQWKSIGIAVGAGLLAMFLLTQGGTNRTQNRRRNRSHNKSRRRRYKPRR